MTRKYITKNFTRNEVVCKCCGKLKIDMMFINRLQALRTAFKTAMYLNSCYRCPKHNKEVGGSFKSQHIYGKAADVFTSGWSPRKKHEFLTLACIFGFNGIGIYENFIHLDDRTASSMWWGGE